MPRRDERGPGGSAQRDRAGRRQDRRVRESRGGLRAARACCPARRAATRRGPQGPEARRAGGGRRRVPPQERAPEMSLARIVEFSRAPARRGAGDLGGGVRCSRCLSIQRLSIDAVPDVTNTQVSILTSASGLSPLEVEQYLTFPIETAMNGMPRVEEIRSISRTAVSAVTVVFQEGIDVWFARQMVSERLKLAENDIPHGYGRPELGAGVDGPGRDLRVLPGLEEAHADGAAHAARLGRRDQAALGPGRRRGERHGRGGQAVPGRPGPEAAGRLSAVAGRHRRASSRRTTPRSAPATSRRTASRSSSAPTPSSTASRTSRTPS